ncbi:MAG: aconitase X catalytic domain-containing protein [Sulfolobales archaeon]
MYLNKYEERMYNGEYGEIIAKAMRIIVKVGESLGARRLVNIEHAHISGVGYSNLGEAGLALLRDLVSENTKFTVYTTANPGSVDLESHKYFTYDEEFLKKQLEILELYRMMGVEAFTCTPYHLREPRLGEHLAWAESNAVLIANSVYGARTNREAGPLALFSAIVGKTYYGGLHLKSERVPKIKISVASIRDSFLEAGLLGLLVGRLAKEKIPFVSGIGKISFEKIKTFLAATGSTGSMGMVFIEKITPLERSFSEISDYIEESIEIEHKDLKIHYEEEPYLCDEPEAFLIGCPHASIEIIRDLKALISEIPGVLKKPVWLVIPSVYFESRELREDLDYLRNRGFIILRNICPVISPLSKLGYKCVGTISSKALFYMPRLAGVRVALMDLRDLIFSAYGVQSLHRS